MIKWKKMLFTKPDGYFRYIVRREIPEIEEYNYFIGTFDPVSDVWICEIGFPVGKEKDIVKIIIQCKSEDEWQYIEEKDYE